MFVASVLVLGLMCCFHQASGALHSFTAHYTAVTGISGFPEFTADGVVDGELIQTYNSTDKKVEPRTEWVKFKGPEDWKRQSDIIMGTEQVFKSSLQTVMKRFNHSGGVHTWQNMYGCQWDDESRAVDGFDQYGYDGEDFVNLDLKNLRYIASTLQSVITKHKWDNDRGFLEGNKAYFTTQCIDWLKKYVQYGRSTLERTVRPEVTVLQKVSGVVCHATGFYPEGVMITWKRDGEEMQEDVDVGETLPNEDGTFQKRAVLTVSPEELKNRQYTCEVAHKSGLLKTLPGEKTLPEEDGNTLAIIIGCFAALVLIGVIVAIVANLMMKKKVYKKAELFNTDSGDSMTPIARKGAECADC